MTFSDLLPIENQVLRETINSNESYIQKKRDEVASLIKSIQKATDELKAQERASRVDNDAMKTTAMYACIEAMWKRKEDMLKVQCQEIERTMKASLAGE